jgi:hypothetical protein
MGATSLHAHGRRLNTGNDVAVRKAAITSR